MNSVKVGLEEKNRTSETQTPLPNKILLVDDDKDQLAFFTNLLGNAGFKVYGADSAEEAIWVMRRLHVDLIVSDLRMPKVDGEEFLRYLRGLHPFNLFHDRSKIPVIILSASDSSVELDLLKLGADMYCQKQLAVKELVPQIKFLLNSAELEA